MNESVKRIGNARPNVVLVILDTLRGDITSSNHGVQYAPWLNRIFRDSFVFTRAYAPSHWTLPSHGSLFTGLPPHCHGAIPPHNKLRSGIPTIADIFRDRGYQTSIVTCNPWVSPMFGMTRGFDTVRIHSAQAREILRIARDRVLAWTRRNAKTRQIVEWLNRLATIVHASPKADNGARAALKDVSTLLRSGYPSHFVTLNLMEAHHPYYARGRLSDWRYRFEHAAPLSDWSGLTFAVLTGRIPVTTSIRRVVSDLYWENVRYLDAQVGRLYEALNHGFLDSSYLILLSDHGQFLGERGLMDHVTGLYEEVIRVPLAIRPPGGVSAEAQEFPVDISWLFPLLVSIARGRDRHPVPNWIAWAQKRGPIISQAHGGIVPHAHAPKAGDSEFTQDLLAFKKEHDHPGIAVVGGSWKLICHLGRKEDEVYDLSASDPERTNHIWEQPEIARQLHDSIATSLSLTDDTVRGPVRQVHNMG